MPGMYAPGHYDLGGFGVGAVERDEVLPKLETISAGDILLAISSSGVHSNGFSLVRRVVEAEKLAWSDAAPFAPGATLAEALLTPTKLYVKCCLPAIRSGRVKALAHITGGGLPENLPRVLPEGLRARVDAGAWQPSPVFHWLAKASRAGQAEMLRTFNCGVGMVLVVAPADAPRVRELITAAGEVPLTIGSLEARPSPTAEQVLVEGGNWGW